MNKLQDVRVAVLGLGSVGLPLAVEYRIHWRISAG